MWYVNHHLLSCRSSGDQPGEALSYIAMVTMKDNNNRKLDDLVQLDAICADVNI